MLTGPRRLNRTHYGRRAYGRIRRGGLPRLMINPGLRRQCLDSAATQALFNVNLLLIRKFTPHTSTHPTHEYSPHKRELTPQTRTHPTHVNSPHTRKFTPHFTPHQNQIPDINSTTRIGWWENDNYCLIPPSVANVGTSHVDANRAGNAQCNIHKG